MSYGDKYKFEYKDQPLGRRTTVIISEDGYAGEVEWIKGGGDPVQIESKSDNNYILNQIYGSECTLTIISETSMKFVDLFNSNAFKYQVTIWKEPEPDESQIVWWIGYLLPDEYSEPLDFYINYEVSLRARDVLGGLKTTDFLNDNGQKYVGKAKVTTIIANCLRKTRLNLFINFSVNLEEVNFPGAIDPLDNIYLDYEAFYTDKIPNCEDVLKQILQSFGARIIMNKGSWWIQRVAVFRSQHTVYVYGSDGTYYYNFLYNPKLDYTGKYDQTNNRLFFAEKKGNLEINAAYKEFEIVQDYGKRKSIIKNYNFQNNVIGIHTVTEQSNDIFYNWNIIQTPPGNSEVSIRLWWEQYAQSLNYSFPNNRLSWYANDPVYISLTNKQLKIKINFGKITNGYFIYKIKIGNTYFEVVGEDGEIATAHNTEYVNEKNWYNINLGSDSIEFTIVEQIEGYFIFSFGGSDAWLKSIETDFILEDAVSPEDVNYKVSVDQKNNEIPEMIKSILGDLPNFLDNEDVYSGGYWGFNGAEFVPTYSWVILSTDRRLSLMEILADTILDQYLRPKQKISGELIGNFDFNHTIIIPFMGNKMYFPIRISLSDKYCKFDVEMIELLETDGEGGKVLATHVPDPIATDLGYLIKVN